MTDATACVFIIDDDVSVRTALARMLRSEGLQVETFATAIDFLEYERPNRPNCLLLDVQMPDVDGMRLQQLLIEEHRSLPIIFITGHGSIPMSVRALKSGAVDFLPKPVDHQELMTAVWQAIDRDIRERRSSSDLSSIRQRFALLTQREREVLEYVVSGSLNKQIGHRLGVTEKTVKVHRGNVMRKMQARSLAELVHIAQKIGIEGPSKPCHRDMRVKV